MAGIKCSCGMQHCNGECAGLRTLISGNLSDSIDLRDATTPALYEPAFQPSAQTAPGQLPGEVTELLNRWYQHTGQNRQVTGVRGGTEPDSKELVAAALIMFLASKPGLIRRTGSTWRGTDAELAAFASILDAMERNEPVPLFFLSFSPKFKNPELTGGQILPDMANYLAFANLHNICNGAALLYRPGLKITIAYEGGLYAKLGGYSEDECHETLRRLHWLNQVSFDNTPGDYRANPVLLVDALELIKSGHLDLPEASYPRRWRQAYRQELVQFRRQVSALARKLPVGQERRCALALSGKMETEDTVTLELAQSCIDALLELPDHNTTECRQLLQWLLFYLQTPPANALTGRDLPRLLRRACCSYAAFNRIKYQGGQLGKGLLDAAPGAIPCTVQGDPEKVSLQLVPLESRFPHHRLTVWGRDDSDYLFAGYRWRLLPMSELTGGNRVYVPRFLNGCQHPFFYEELKPAEEIGVMYRVVMESSVAIYTRDNGSRYTVKRADGSKGVHNLKLQAARARELRGLGIKALPEPLEVVAPDGGYCVAYRHLPGQSADWVLLGRTLSKDEFLARFNDILSFLYRELWSKSSSEVEMEAFSRCYGRTIRRGINLAQNSTHPLIGSFEGWEGGTINNRLIPSLSLVLSIVERMSGELDGEFMEVPCVATTHGDLHLGNIICGDDGSYGLMEVNGNPDRRDASVEFELSRLLLSFWREIIRCKEFVLDTEGDKIWVRLTPRGERLLELRQLALDAILSHPHLEWYVTTRHSSLVRILLMEAIDIGSAFGYRAPDEQAVTYFMGTLLLRQALDAWQASDIADWDEIRGLFNQTSYRDRRTHQEANAKFLARLIDRYQHYTLLHSFGHFCIAFTDRDGAAFICFELTSELEPLLPGHAIERHVLGDSTIAKMPLMEFLVSWQRINAPGVGLDKLYTGFIAGDSLLWNAYLENKIITICGTDFVVDEFAGLGGEAKVFRVTDKEGRSYAAKISMQRLADEYSFGRRIKSRAGNHAWRFPEYFAFDQEANIILQEFIPGTVAAEWLPTLDMPGSWCDLFSELAEIVAVIAALAEEGVYAGRFDLYNIIIDPSLRYRLVDHYYPGDTSLYDIKQPLRIIAALAQAVYHLNTTRFSLGVKAATKPSEVALLRLPNSELVDERLVPPKGMPAPLHGELARLVRKYLSGRHGDCDLKEVARDFRHIKKLCGWLKDGWGFVPDKLPIRALAVDLNGTIEDGGCLNMRTRDCLARLAGERGVPIAIITGKRYEKTKECLIANGLDPRNFHIYSDAGGALWHNNVKTDLGVVEKPELVARVLQEFITRIYIEGTVFYNQNRLCLSLEAPLAPDHLADLADLCRNYGLTPIASQRVPQIDIVPEGCNKGTALEHFLALHLLREDEVLKIGDDPYGNDADLLFAKGMRRPNAFAVASLVDTACLVEQVMDCSGYGALQQSGPLPFPGGTLIDFSAADPDEVAAVAREARNTSNVFYPWESLAERFSSKDTRTVQFKWLVRNDNGDPVGIWSLGMLASEPGIYLSCGSYLVPDAQGKGIAEGLLGAIEAFCRKIAGFRKLRAMIPETNLASRSLLERCGFQPVEVRKNGFPLTATEVHKYQAGIVYEKGDISEGRHIRLKGHPDLMAPAKARELYERLRNTPG